MARSLRHTRGRHGGHWLLMAQGWALVLGCGGQSESQGAIPPGAASGSGAPSAPMSGEGTTPAAGDTPNVPLDPMPIDPMPIDPVPDSVPLDSVPLDPVPSDPMPSAEPVLRDCDDGATIRIGDQASIDALRGCTSVHGLFMAGLYDLRPLDSLRRVGAGGLGIAGNTPITGLEQLAEVDNLTFQATRVLDLSVLESLRRVGALTIRSVEIPNFKGLERAEGIRALDLTGNVLIESLDGLSLPSEMTSVRLNNDPALSDTSAFASVTHVSDSIDIQYTGLTALGFEQLTGSTATVTLIANPALADLSGILNLESIGDLVIAQTALRSPLAFARLSELRSFDLGGNDQLQVSPSFPLLTSIEALYVGGNASLESLSGLAALETAGYIYVSQNPSLTAIDLPSLRRAERLHVFENLAMDGAAVAATLAAVDSPESRIQPVQMAAPTSPCPWVGDTLCDADTGLCLASEDPACPAALP